VSSVAEWLIDDGDERAGSQEVPYDPHLPFLFFGEESSMAVRMWTHGWDFFSPPHHVIYHLWSRSFPLSLSLTRHTPHRTTHNTYHDTRQHNRQRGEEVA
jgi:hypothetical protein